MFFTFEFQNVFYAHVCTFGAHNHCGYGSNTIHKTHVKDNNETEGHGNNSWAKYKYGMGIMVQMRI